MRALRPPRRDGAVQWTRLHCGVATEQKGVRERKRKLDEAVEEVEEEDGAAHAVQTKNDELRWGPDGGQKHATGPKPRPLFCRNRLPSYLYMYT